MNTANENSIRIPVVCVFMYVGDEMIKLYVIRSKLHLRIYLPAGISFPVAFVRRAKTIVKTKAIIADRAKPVTGWAKLIPKVMSKSRPMDIYYGRGVKDIREVTKCNASHWTTYLILRLLSNLVWIQPSHIQSHHQQPRWGHKRRWERVHYIDTFEESLVEDDEKEAALIIR